MRRRRWKPVAALLVAAFVAAFFALPDVLARTQMRQIIQQQLLPAHSAQLNIAAVSAGWFSPVSARGVYYRTNDWELSVEAVETNRTLLDLLRDHRDLGEVRLVQPHLLILPKPEFAQSSRHKKSGQRKSNATARANRPNPLSVHLLAVAGEFEMLGPGDRRMALAHHVELDLQTDVPRQVATFAAIARTGELNETAHVSARGAVRWPPRPLAASLNELTLEFVGVDTRPLDPLLECAGIPLATDPLTRRAASIELLGRLSGSAAVRFDNNRAAAAELNIELQDCELSLPNCKGSLREPVMTVNATGKMANGEFQIEAVRVITDSLGLDASGTVSDWNGSRTAAITGTITSDWQVLSDRLSAFLPGGLVLNGRERRAWSLAGPLRPGDSSDWLGSLRIDAAAAIDSLKWTDLETGPLELSAHLHEGTIALEPVVTSFHGGTVAIQPEIQFGDSGAVLRIAPGRVVNGVALDRALCDRILRYVDPLSTVTGTLQGRMSFEIDQLEFPLSREGVNRGVISGRLVLEDVEFVADESLREILAGVGVQLPNHLRTTQSIAIRMAAGRVYHTGLAIPLHDQQVTMDGWVGLDHTLQICLSVPVTEKMLGREKRLYRLLRGQRINLPIVGTLERPKIDEQELSRNVQRLVQSAVRDNLISDESLRGLLRKAQ